MAIEDDVNVRDALETDNFEDVVELRESKNSQDDNEGEEEHREGPVSSLIPSLLEEVAKHSLDEFVAVADRYKIQRAMYLVA